MSWLSALGSAVPVVSDIASAWMGSKNVDKTNDAMRGMADNANAYSARMAKDQMDFQERMSSSAHSREVHDLKEAGLNPLLSANSGASSPGGAAGSVSVPSLSAPPSKLAGVGASAREQMALSNELKTARAQRMNLDMDTQRKDADTKNAELSGSGLKLENELMSMRNNFFKKYPWAFKLNAAAGGINSASGVMRLLK